MTDAPDTIMLDGVAFVACLHERAQAFRGDVLLGELDLDELFDTWKARRCADGVFGEWRPMRSAAEARAYLVSDRPWFPVASALMKKLNQED